MSVKEAFVADSRAAERAFKVQSAALLRSEYEAQAARLERAAYLRLKAEPLAPTATLVHDLLLSFSDSLVRSMVEGVQESARDSVYALERLLVCTLGSASKLSDHTFSAGLRERATLHSELAQQQAAAKLAGRVYTQLSSAVGTPRERATRIGEVLDAHWWQVHRLARTEAAVAYNAVRVEALRAISGDFPRLMQRWTERLDDPDAVGVAADSVVMHGQVVSIGSHFFMPGTAGRWAHPPNRPNDGGVITPWQSGWDIPAWSWAGQKIWHV